MSKPDTEARAVSANLRDASGGPGAEPALAVSATSLPNGRREVIIRRAGERYRLRVPANDKLILTT